MLLMQYCQRFRVQGEKLGVQVVPNLRELLLVSGHQHLPKIPDQLCSDVLHVS